MTLAVALMPRLCPGLGADDWRPYVLGALAQRVTRSDRGPTQFQSGVNKVAWLLICFMFVMSPLVLFINGLTKHDWLEAFLFALSIAVGLTPEMLPMIVMSTLAKGAVLLSRSKVVVKRLDAIQNFGAMDVLCTVLERRSIQWQGHRLQAVPRSGRCPGTGPPGCCPRPR